VITNFTELRPNHYLHKHTKHDEDVP